MSANENNIPTSKVIEATAREALKTPCERYAARREVFERTGTEMSELIWRGVNAELHQEAIDAGEPCPCGMDPVTMVT